MYNSDETINLSSNIEKIKKIKDDLIDNYFFISNFLAEKKKGPLDIKASNKIESIQSKLDFAMNFSISKIDLLILNLTQKMNDGGEMNTTHYDNHDFLITDNNLNLPDDELINNSISAVDSDVFSNLDFSEFASSDDDDDDVFNINKNDDIDDDFNSKNTSEITVSPSEILFFNERINDIEAKTKKEIDDLKIENKFISEINDNLLIEINKLSSRPILNNSTFETNEFYLSLEKKMDDIISEINTINQSFSKINDIDEKIDNFIEPISNTKINEENYYLQHKVDDLKKDNDLYKRKFQSSIAELEILKAQSHEYSYNFNNDKNYLTDTSKKLENLENIISQQINDFKDIEVQRNELAKLFENKIIYLKNKLEEKENQLSYLDHNALSSKQMNNEHYSLLMKIEDKLNNLNNNFAKQDDLETLKNDLTFDRKDETDKIIDYLNEKNAETFSKIKNDFIDSFEKINESAVIKNYYLNENDNRVDFREDNSIKSENTEKNNIIKEQCLDESILEINLINDLEINITKLREFENFLLDLTLKIDDFK